MKNIHRIASLVVIVSMSSPAFAGDKKLLRSAVPPPVLATADRETSGASIKGYATEVEHGQRVYEVETLLDGHSRDLQIASDGTLNEIEEEVPLPQLPEAVRTALVTRSKGASITKVESLTKHGKLVAYEASTDRHGHKGEVQVGPAGEALSHEE